MVLKKSFFYNNHNWNYVVNFKQQKHMYLKVNDGIIMISAPFFVETNVVENFIIKNINHIIKQMAKKQTLDVKLSLLEEPFIYFLGQKLAVSLKLSRQTKLLLSDTTLFIYSPFAHRVFENYEFFIKKITVFLKQTATPIFIERARFWAQKMSLSMQKLNLKWLKTKWGICYPQSQTIVLNCFLIHFNLSIIDYVVIHEMAHLLHPNHSRQFWDLVANYCPNLIECRKILKNSRIEEFRGKNYFTQQSQNQNIANFTSK